VLFLNIFLINYITIILSNHSKITQKRFYTVKAQTIFGISLVLQLDEIKRLQRVAEKNKKLDKTQLEDNVYTPFIHLIHSSKQKEEHQASFLMEFTWDGQIFVDREEKIFSKGEPLIVEGQLTHYLDYLPLSLRWQVGQLHYDENAVNG